MRLSFAARVSQAMHTSQRSIYMVMNWFTEVHKVHRTVVSPPGTECTRVHIPGLIRASTQTQAGSARPAAPRCGAPRSRSAACPPRLRRRLPPRPPAAPLRPPPPAWTCRSTAACRRALPRMAVGACLAAHPGHLRCQPVPPRLSSCCAPFKSLG